MPTKTVAPGDQSEKEIELSQFEVFGSELLEKLREISKIPSDLGKDIARRYNPSLESVDRIRISEEIDGAFELVDGEMVFNSEPLRELFRVVARDVVDQKSALHPSEFHALLEQVFAVYLLHELRHITQGIGSYQSVKIFKSFERDDIVSEFDLFADRDAALAFAAAFSVDLDDRSEILDYFKQALFFSGLYFFKAFRFDSSREHKKSRALGILLMNALLTKKSFGEPIVENANLPLDACISVKIFDKQAGVAVFSHQPTYTLMGIGDSNHVAMLEDMVLKVEIGDFEAALSIANYFLCSLKPMK